MSGFVSSSKPKYSRSRLSTTIAELFTIGCATTDGRQGGAGWNFAIAPRPIGVPEAKTLAALIGKVLLDERNDFGERTLQTGESPALVPWGSKLAQGKLGPRKTRAAEARFICRARASSRPRGCD